MIKTRMSAIWLDKRQAWIYKTDGEVEEFEKVESAVDEMKPSGGYRGDSPDQSQGGTPDDKILNRQLGQFRTYFDEIIAKVRDAEKLVIEGPAETKLGLLKRIKEQKRLNNIELNIKNADSMTINEFKAEARTLLSNET